jgi:hypothetical protein
VFDVCPGCGEYRPDRDVRPSEGIAVCACGDVQPFRPGPLFLVGGACATGKSTVLNRLARRELPVLPLDGDILWCDAFGQGVRQYAEIWLRMAKNIGLVGKPVAIFAGGLVVPDNVEPCVQRRYFSEVHRLALVCSDEALVARLEQRPAWRGASRPDVLEAQREFNRGLARIAEREGIELVDTTSISIDAAADRIEAWMRAALQQVGYVSIGGSHGSNDDDPSS